MFRYYVQYKAAGTSGYYRQNMAAGLNVCYKNVTLFYIKKIPIKVRFLAVPRDANLFPWLFFPLLNILVLAGGADGWLFS